MRKANIQQMKNGWKETENLEKIYITSTYFRNNLIKHSNKTKSNEKQFTSLINILILKMQIVEILKIRFD